MYFKMWSIKVMLYLWTIYIEYNTPYGSITLVKDIKNNINCPSAALINHRSGVKTLADVSDGLYNRNDSSSKRNLQTRSDVLNNSYLLVSVRWVIFPNPHF